MPNRPPTSTAAHRRTLHAAPRDRGRILDLLREDEDGMTCYQVEQRLKMPHQTASARMSELAAEGHIMRTMNWRYTNTGSKATVYRLAAHLAGACRGCLGKGCLLCEEKR